MSEQEPQQPSSAGTEKAEHGSVPSGMIPKYRFDEINERMKVAEKLVSDLQAQLTAQQEAKLAEQQEYQKLYEQAKAKLTDVQATAAQVDDWKAAIRATVEAEIAQLPEDVREMVPQFDDPRQTLAWLNANKQRLMRPPAPQLDAGARGDTPPASAELTDEDRRMAKLSGVDLEDWANFKKMRAKQQQQAKDWMRDLGGRITLPKE